MPRTSLTTDERIVDTLKRGLALTVVLLPLPLAAHHSFLAFDTEKETVVRGTISGYHFRNPHVYFMIDVPQESGEVVTWKIETETRNDLYRNGWRDDSLRSGDVVAARVNPPKDPAVKFGRLISVEKSDGMVLATPNADDTRGRSNIVPATDLNGVWFPIQASFFEYRAKLGALATEEAIRERAELASSGALDRRAQCIEHPIPLRMGLAHVYEIEIVSDDLVLIHSEDDAEARRIDLVGPEHPVSIAEDERNYTGHSIGHWQGNTLVVDTIHFKPIPGEVGPQKHLVERYRLSDDKTHVIIDFTVEDPDYLNAPISHTYQWQHSPHIIRLPFSCDLETAGWYLEAERGL